MKYWSVPIVSEQMDFFCDRTQEDCSFEVSFSDNAKVLQWSWFGDQEKQMFTPEGMAIGAAVALAILCPILMPKLSKKKADKFSEKKLN